MLDKCPFCGSSEAPFLITYHGKDGWRDRYSVICSYNNGGCGAEGGWYHTEAEAIEHWNMRSSGWISVKDKLPNVGERVLVFGSAKSDWTNGGNVVAISFMSDQNIFDSRAKTDPYWISPWAILYVKLRNYSLDVVACGAERRRRGWLNSPKYFTTPRECATAPRVTFVF